MGTMSFLLVKSEQPKGLPSLERLIECGWDGVEQFMARYHRGRIDREPPRNESEMIQHYLHGFCAVFALTVHGRTGWPLVGLFEYGEHRVPKHVGCRRPDGRFVDARGDDLDLATFSEGFAQEEGWLQAPREVDPEAMARRFKRHPFWYDLAQEHVDVLLPCLDFGPRP